MSSSLTPSQIAMNVARLLPANQLLLDLQGGPVIQAFIMEDFTYALGNTWESMWEELMGTAASAIQTGQQFLASLDIGGMGQVRLQSVTQTIAQWHGSERISFTLPLVFVATDNSMDVVNPVRWLNNMSLPTRGGALGPAAASTVLGLVGGTIGSQYGTIGAIAGAGAGALLGQFASDLSIVSPSADGRGFQANADRVVSGGLGFAYGQWFMTPPFFVVRKWTPTLSKATILGADGFQRPLMAAGTLQIEAYRTIFADEFNGWFVTENWRGDAGAFIAQNIQSW